MSIEKLIVPSGIPLMLTLGYLILDYKQVTSK